jgi:hypothetical protein
MRSNVRGDSMHRTVAVLITTLACLAFSNAVAAAATTTVNDPDDVSSRLDVRSVSIAPIQGGEMARITVTFWNGFPTRMLHRHPIQVDLGVDRHVAYDQAILRNAAGGLRIVWGEGGSNCCFVNPAAHPDRFTYSATFPNLLEAEPPPNSLRGWSSKRVDCERRTCYLFEGRILDRTAWVDI